MLLYYTSLTECLAHQYLFFLRTLKNIHLSADILSGQNRPRTTGTPLPAIKDVHKNTVYVGYAAFSGKPCPGLYCTSFTVYITQ